MATRNTKDRATSASAEAEAADRNTAEAPGRAAGDHGPEDDLVSTRHTLTVKRRKLAYTATTGRLVLREEVHTDGAFDGHLPKAEVFLTAYTLDGADPTQRPVTFAFNGGPGSASVWLHLGLLGPRRVLSGDVGELVPPPYGLADNPETLLVHSDLVFIDPVSTGYSRAVTGGKPDAYHGFQGDIESIAEIIRLWTSRNGRWLSPKFLAGESYGTLRAAALAEHLQSRYGLYPNGIMLISAVLDYITNDFNEGNDLPYPLHVPTYAAIAHHHGRHGDRPLADVLAEAEEFAIGDYPWALARGHRLTARERSATVARLAALTGLSEDYVDRVNLRIEHIRFFTELLRDRRQVVGRLDGRFVGWDPDAGREHFAADPSLSALTGAYTAAFNHYVRAELNYHNDLPYEVITRRVRPWSFREFEGAHVTVADKLAAAMRANPHLKVHVSSGYHDGATPYFATEHTLAHLAIPEVLRDNIETAYYPAGHMMYVHEPSRLRQSADLAGFVRANTNR
ncbi:S10 family peptidase [Goodfellowiella coeruleoviolacea]|uniref:Carboxypeptidase C (Cathepsin A) n=1 Tax=Goodfellowiella coeruleoviolacea TaxID=334858 RepID=A0AAE3GG69_9PSEU|nr:peptidase S10 [Goodfellowiella coeruleoviolacea]MCP2165553.1 Carboxypeptidase C (cathepsin A) [Goodfellowiella coeruleoviolacea]